MTSNFSSNAVATGIFVCYLSTCFSLLSLIIHDLWRRYRFLNSSNYNSISALSTRSLHLFTFLAFTLASVAVTWYYMLTFFALSYRVWAHDAGVSSNEDIQLGPWLRDVELFRDAWEVVLEAPQRLVWSQPIFFISAAWSVFLGLEARKHHIRHSWAYMLLGQLVAICFAQNLFYLAILLSPPVPLSAPSAHAASQRMWTPRRTFYGVPLLLTTISVALIPYVVNTSDFLTVLYIPHVLLVLPPLLHNTLPRGWGITHQSSREAGEYYRVVFWGILISGLVLQVKTTVVALRDTSLVKHHHRHSVLYPGSWNEEESPWAAIWAGFSDHPAVSSVGWDTIICTLSFMAWISTQRVGIGAFLGPKGQAVPGAKLD